MDLFQLKAHSIFRSGCLASAGHVGKQDIQGIWVFHVNSLNRSEWLVPVMFVAFDASKKQRVVVPWQPQEAEHWVSLVARFTESRQHSQLCQVTRITSKGVEPFGLGSLQQQHQTVAFCLRPQLIVSKNVFREKLALKMKGWYKFRTRIFRITTIYCLMLYVVLPSTSRHL